MTDADQLQQIYVTLLTNQTQSNGWVAGLMDAAMVAINKVELHKPVTWRRCAFCCVIFKGGSVSRAHTHTQCRHVVGRWAELMEVIKVDSLSCCLSKPKSTHRHKHTVNWYNKYSQTGFICLFVFCFQVLSEFCFDSLKTGVMFLAHTTAESLYKIAAAKSLFSIHLKYIYTCFVVHSLFELQAFYL